MILTVASGKGGTGKTTFAVNMAWVLAQNGQSVRLLDCDVEEPNDHLFIDPEFDDIQSVKALKPAWNAERCTACGACIEACNFNALALVKDKVLIFNELCHACGACSYVCPTGALSEHPVSIGEVRGASGGAGFDFADGLLHVGESLAPTVVKAVKQRVKSDAINILDASPGTACPVVEAIEGADVVALVTEPTPFGLHDLKLALHLALQIGVPTGIIINRSDGADPLIADYAESVGVPILGRIPFRREYAEAYSRGEILAETFPDLQPLFRDIYAHVEALAKTTPPAPPPETDILPKDENPAPLESGEATSFNELVVISGKGGTGKTSILSSLAILGGKQILADNDVDAADLHLLLNPKVRTQRIFSGGAAAWIDPEKCLGCGACAQICHFDAIHEVAAGNEYAQRGFEVNQASCEGCGLCPRVCPVEAIEMRERKNGIAYESRTDYGPMAHARLGIAEENSGKLVTEVRHSAARMAKGFGYARILADGPPGTGCPVIASITGVDSVLIVTEPTVSGVHDLRRVLNLCRHFGVDAAIAINKCDLNAEQANAIHTLAEEAGARVVGEIPFDREVHDALMLGRTVVEQGSGPAAEAIRELWKNIASRASDRSD